MWNYFHNIDPPWCPFWGNRTATTACILVGPCCRRREKDQVRNPPRWRCRQRKPMDNAKEVEANASKKTREFSWKTFPAVLKAAATNLCYLVCVPSMPTMPASFAVCNKLIHSTSFYCAGGTKCKSCVKHMWKTRQMQDLLQMSKHSDKACVANCCSKSPMTCFTTWWDPNSKNDPEFSSFAIFAWHCELGQHSNWVQPHSDQVEGCHTCKDRSHWNLRSLWKGWRVGYRTPHFPNLNEISHNLQTKRSNKFWDLLMEVLFNSFWARLLEGWTHDEESSYEDTIHSQGNASQSTRNPLTLLDSMAHKTTLNIWLHGHFQMLSLEFSEFVTKNCQSLGSVSKRREAIQEVRFKGTNGLKSPGHKVETGKGTSWNDMKTL